MSNRPPNPDRTSHGVPGHERPGAPVPGSARLPAGKLAPEFLARLIETSLPPEVAIGPRIGEDACAIEVEAGMLVAATDPITLTGAGVEWTILRGLGPPLPSMMMPMPALRRCGPAERSTMNAKALEEAALNLPPDERAALAQTLLLSLDEPSEAELERTWLAEAARRARELDRGDVRAIPAEEVRRKARSLLR